jgi:hypothetical protein
MMLKTSAAISELLSLKCNVYLLIFRARLILAYENIRHTTLFDSPPLTQTHSQAKRQNFVRRVFFSFPFKQNIMTRKCIFIKMLCFAKITWH